VFKREEKMAKSKTNDSYNVSYTLRDNSGGDDIISVSMNWENRDLEEVKKNFNTFLNSIGVDLVVTDKK
jgi:hypothetical protein